MSHRVIWLDVDGVLLDYTSAFLKFSGLDKQGHTYDNIFDYNLSKLFRGGLEECRAVMYRFTQSEDFKSLSCIALLQDVEMLFNMGFKLRIITTLPTDAQYKVTRVKALTAHFGAVFDEMVFTDWTDSKLDYVLNRSVAEGGTHIIIEDNPKLLIEVDEFLERKHTAYHYPMRNLICYAIRHPYNYIELSKMKQVIVCHDFHHVAGMIATEALQVA